MKTRGRIRRPETDAQGWIPWMIAKRGFCKLVCCDCGLSHVLEFHITKSREVNFRAKIDHRSTGQVRRHMKEKT